MAVVVIADPDMAFAQMLTRLSRRHGHQAVCVHTGRALLEQLRQTPVDLCVLDLSLPDLDGLALIPEIRRRRPYVKLLAVYQSVLFDREMALLSLRMARLLGADRVLLKPFTCRTFLTVLQDLLGMRFRSAPRLTPMA